jgi:sentrin-specific protease 8
MSDDDKVLSYYDVLLRQEDVDLLTGFGNSWLNDNVIAFYFEYLSKEKFKSKFKGISEITLIPGAATYLLTSAGTFFPNFL